MANIDVEMGEFANKTTLANSDYVVVSLENGTQGKIKVSDLASVVAGVLGNPLGFKRLLTDGEDLNDITDNGYYMIRLSSAGALLNSPIPWDGGLIVINISYFLVQIVIGSNAENTYIRTKWGASSLTHWRSII